MPYSNSMCKPRDPAKQKFFLLKHKWTIYGSLSEYNTMNSKMKYIQYNFPVYFLNQSVYGYQKLYNHWLKQSSIVEWLTGIVITVKALIFADTFFVAKSVFQVILQSFFFCEINLKMLKTFPTTNILVRFCINKVLNLQIIMKKYKPGKKHGFYTMKVDAAKFKPLKFNMNMWFLV